MKGIVFFSKDGNTKKGAQVLGEITGAEVIELKEARKGNFIQALLKRGSKLIGNPWEEASRYDTLYIMTPIWASNGTPAMNSFIEKSDFHEKKIEIITFQQFEDYSNSDQVHQYLKEKIMSKGGTVIATHACLGGKMGHCMNEDKIRNQIEHIKIDG